MSRPDTARPLRVIPRDLGEIWILLCLLVHAHTCTMLVLTPTASRACVHSVALVLMTAHVAPPTWPHPRGHTHVVTHCCSATDRPSSTSCRPDPSCPIPADRSQILPAPKSLPIPDACSQIVLIPADRSQILPAPKSLPIPDACSRFAGMPIGPSAHSAAPLSYLV